MTEPAPSPSAPAKRKPGRPPSEAARQAVLQAAYRIVVDEGLGRLTIDRVAAQTGVGKPTIYRFCTNAQELAMAAFMAQPQAESPTSTSTPSSTLSPKPQRAGTSRSQAAGAPHNSPTRRALQAQLGRVVETFASPRGRQITLTMASADPESELAKAFRNQVILKSRQTGREILEQGVHGGEVRADTQIDTVLDMVYGPIFFRLLAGHLPLSTSFAQQIVDAVFEGIAT